MSTDLERLDRIIIAASRWIDEAPDNAARSREAATWGRVAKVAEECGEAVSALIAVTGQNPRKGYSGSWASVERELLDVAITALCAYSHLKGNAIGAMAALAQHAEFLRERAELEISDE